MKRTPIAPALRRALVLALGASAVTACGGSVDGSTPDPSGAVCSVVAGAPVAGVVGGCAQTYDLTTPATTCGPVDVARCESLCPVDPRTKRPALSCDISDRRDGSSVIGQLSCQYFVCATGRRPEGVAPGSVLHPDPVARLLAEIAHLEAVSVDAFEILASELDAHDAPGHLRDGARRAARDEARHARVMTALAMRAGARPPDRRVEPRGARSLRAIAIENAVEGCVRETFGAFVAMFQAERAEDPCVRAAMDGISGDEVRHAELSWELARWLDGQLDERARREVACARSAAVAALAASLACEPGPAAMELGLPTPRDASVAFAELSATLWR